MDFPALFTVYHTDIIIITLGNSNTYFPHILKAKLPRAWVWRVRDLKSQIVVEAFSPSIQVTEMYLRNMPLKQDATSTWALRVSFFGYSVLSKVQRVPNNTCSLAQDGSLPFLPSLQQFCGCPQDAVVSPANDSIMAEAAGMEKLSPHCQKKNSYMTWQSQDSSNEWIASQMFSWIKP